MFWPLLVCLAVIVAIFWFCVRRLPKAPRPRAAVLLAYMVALLAAYVWIAWLGLLMWENHTPYLIKEIPILAFIVGHLGTLALFFGIFCVPTLVGLVIWRLVVLIGVLAKPESKTPGYR
jgi:hypothetical protein